MILTSDDKNGISEPKISSLVELGRDLNGLNQGLEKLGVMNWRERVLNRKEWNLCD